ncbi:helix-turn-helix domain-containing protein [Paenibacillus kyungheensis]|uniref:Helix-turn-helix domain-containing protein n=1 Tax=Paenibacillus kyungheensis TaxID=1452732 RepID=A0AAX3M2P6_9BACL|nr:helix-turn-helix domain-containing protein [Paenibacillus kyungheensis]WCT56426.1 helix-turn-helix domain-containing protein [Paenibacillus kyungheensis]
MLAKLLIQAQQHQDPEVTLHILESFTPKIKASLRQVSADYRDDLKQELYLKMIEVIQTFDIRGDQKKNEK